MAQYYSIIRSLQRAAHERDIILGGDINRLRSPFEAVCTAYYFVCMGVYMYRSAY